MTDWWSLLIKCLIIDDNEENIPIYPFSKPVYYFYLKYQCVLSLNIVLHCSKIYNGVKISFFPLIFFYDIVPVGITEKEHIVLSAYCLKITRKIEVTSNFVQNVISHILNLINCLKQRNSVPHLMQWYHLYINNELLDAVQIKKKHNTSLSIKIIFNSD